MEEFEKLTKEEKEPTIEELREKLEKTEKQNEKLKKVARTSGVRKRELKEQVTKDPLTKTLNKHGLEIQFNLLYSQLKSPENNQRRQGLENVAVVFADLDHFKPVNDAFGHEAGDMVLQEFSKKIKESIREGDLLARKGGDEFVIVLAGVDEEGANRVLEKIRRNIDAFTVEYNGAQIDVNASFGLQMVKTDDGKMLSPDEAIDLADGKMYQAKGDRKRQN